ncbi:MAG TPA: hypothetical protein IAA29_16865 [Candidatus Paenibacillus intestinavium]|nr:hypothetical protein [Candidatus Paenibacillus intestinavium]
MNNNNVGISEKMPLEEQQISSDELLTVSEATVAKEQQKEENVAGATSPSTENSNWKALYRDIAAYAKTIRKSNEQ